MDILGLRCGIFCVLLLGNPVVKVMSMSFKMDLNDVGWLYIKIILWAKLGVQV
jgi:hypothetical protein